MIGAFFLGGELSPPALIVVFVLELPASSLPSSIVPKQETVSYSSPVLFGRGSVDAEDTLPPYLLPCRDISVGVGKELIDPRPLPVTTRLDEALTYRFWG